MRSRPSRVPSRRWHPWQFKVQFCQASCTFVTPAGDERGRMPAGEPCAGPAARAARSPMPRTTPSRPARRRASAQSSARSATRRCAPAYFFSRATPKIRATVQVYDWLLVPKHQVTSLLVCGRTTGPVAVVVLAGAAPPGDPAAAIVVRDDVIALIGGIAAGADPGDGRHLGARRAARHAAAVARAQRAVDRAVAPIIALGAIARILRIARQLRRPLSGIRIVGILVPALGALRDRQAAASVAAPASNPPRMPNMLRLEVRLAMPRNTFSVN